MENLENKILNKIKEENLKPKSFWYFLIKDYSLWLLVLLSVLLASLCIAPIIFIFQNLEFGYMKHITTNIFFLILLMLPYTWVLLCLVTTYFAKKAWEKTKKGYRFDGSHIVAYSIVASIFLGFVWNYWNFGKDIDEGAQKESFGFYKSLEERKQENWFKPDEGRFIGNVGEVSTTSFTLTNDLNKFSETILFDADVPGIQYLINDNQIRIIGYKDESGKFFACTIFPDNMLPPKMREDLKDKMKEQFINHPECKEMFDKGRANFRLPRENRPDPNIQK